LWFKTSGRATHSLQARVLGNHPAPRKAMTAQVLQQEVDQATLRFNGRKSLLPAIQKHRDMEKGHGSIILDMDMMRDFLCKEKPRAFDVQFQPQASPTFRRSSRSQTGRLVRLDPIDDILRSEKVEGGKSPTTPRRRSLRPATWTEAAKQPYLPVRPPTAPPPSLPRPLVTPQPPVSPQPPATPPVAAARRLRNMRACGRTTEDKMPTNESLGRLATYAVRHALEAACRKELAKDCVTCVTARVMARLIAIDVVKATTQSVAERLRPASQK